MARITNETPHLVDGFRPIRKRPVNPREHGVEASGQSTHLGVGRGIAQALGEIATGEAGRRSFHLPQRSEGAGDEQAREKSAENNGDEAGGYKDRGEVLNCLTGLFQINSNNQGGGAFRHRGLTHDVQRVDVKAPIGVAIDARGSGGVIVVENPPAVKRATSGW